ncbi:MAG: 1-(5-phosphoribosyl)-5-[(5-phosphoribosylamino)methylideneamino]imidazole-4-carboxamide isomerase [Candidatus Omnitrophica bacterium]|nr:1-(5-phosphoribosyl)-5-[(5-phosphoribosylamino)methylideneamino]imidazole-4-carboxamide isomerase [Candidatus Omnitrophota bacterium]
MLIIPAIDIIDGCVVRLFQGKFNQKTSYSRDPLKTAKHWARQGAELIHVVDLDGAISGKAKNIALIKKMAAELEIPIEVGGGIRNMATIEELLDSKVKRVVLGTKAIEDPEFLKKAFSKFKNKVMVSADVNAGKLVIKGWQVSYKRSDLGAFLKNIKAIGMKELIFTDTSKDGTLKGPNIKDLKNMLKTTGLKIISSGGISSLEDIYKLKMLEINGLSGVIIGKALYEGKFSLKEALKFS